MSESAAGLQNQKPDTDPATVAGPLKFKVAPNIVEDLGLNLYTSLPRILAEFVANAYDADSPSADVIFDHDAIQAARQKMRDAFKAEKKRAEKEGYPIEALANQTLPAELSITVADTGDGMSRDDLAHKFLVAGRRRRLEDAESYTAKRRLIMGRKGLGKLAGFGVAKRVAIVTRKKGEPHATKISLSFDQLVKKRTTDEIDVAEEKLADGGGFEVSGTKVILSELLYDPTKSRKETVNSELAEHFEMIRPEDFAIGINGEPVRPLVREFAFAWPSPEVHNSLLVDSEYVTEEGRTIPFRYRMRFTLPEMALPGQRRGVRVYARGRLAAAPSLLDADTNMHGFRMTDYLDGVVHADFLDSFPNTDLIATDRQSLRWESPLLAPLRDKLSEEISEACKNYQKVRDGATPGIVKKDVFTLDAIEKQGLFGRDRTLAIRIGSTLAASCKQGVSDPTYRTKYPEILRGIGQGNLLAAIAGLAAEDRPDLHRVAAKILQLTHEEIDAFVSIAKGRINGIAALKKIVEDADFSKKKNEKEVQQLLENASWMVDSAYSPTLTANEALTTLYQRLAEELAIGKYSPKDAEGDDDRPDLVFLLGNQAGGRLVIVELKAPNVPLDSDHLDQLLDYMRRAKEWLRVNAPGQSFAVHGELIGMLDLKSRARKQSALRSRMEEAGPESKWRVRTFIRVLNDTQQVHAEMLAARAKSASAGADDLDGDEQQ